MSRPHCIHGGSRVMWTVHYCQLSDEANEHLCLLWKHLEWHTVAWFKDQRCCLTTWFLQFLLSFAGHSRVHWGEQRRQLLLLPVQLANQSYLPNCATNSGSRVVPYYNVSCKKNMCWKLLYIIEHWCMWLICKLVIFVPVPCVKSTT